MKGDIAQQTRGGSNRLTVFRYAGALLAVAIGVLLGLGLEPVMDATVPMLMAVLVAAWFSGLRAALLASVIATLAVDYFFTPPLYTFTPEIAHIPRLVMFTLTAGLSATASAARRTAERSLKQGHEELEAKVRERTADLTRANARLATQYAVTREQANLLDLTHDTIFVRDMNDVIRYWNHGAEERYGWTSEEAVGQVSHRLMQTIFRAPLEEINAQLLRTSRWEGELVHATRDGTQVVVASRWSLQRGADGTPVAILETNNDITDRRRAEQELEGLAGRLIGAQEQERSRIGRELHDHISQMLGVLTIRIDQLRADEATPPSLAAALEELRQSTSGVTDDIHSLSHRLHSSALDYLGLVPALQKLVSEFSTRHGIAVVFAHESVPAPLPSEVSLCLFRVTEESLTNIAKHSHAQSARVQLDGRADGLHLTIEDAGAGFDPEGLERKAGLGFVSIRERLRVLRGTVRIDSAPSRGTTIDVRVPAASLVAPAPTEVAGSTTSSVPPSSNVSFA